MTGRSRVVAEGTRSLRRCRESCRNGIGGARRFATTFVNEGDGEMGAGTGYKRDVALWRPDDRSQLIGRFRRRAGMDRRLHTLADFTRARDVFFHVRRGPESNYTATFTLHECWSQSSPKRVGGPHLSDNRRRGLTTITRQCALRADDTEHTRWTIGFRFPATLLGPSTMCTGLCAVPQRQFADFDRRMLTARACTLSCCRVGIPTFTDGFRKRSRSLVGNPQPVDMQRGVTGFSRGTLNSTDLRIFALSYAGFRDGFGRPHLARLRGSTGHSWVAAPLLATRFPGGGGVVTPDDLARGKEFRESQRRAASKSTQTVVDN